MWSSVVVLSSMLLPPLVNSAPAALSDLKFSLPARGLGDDQSFLATIPSSTNEKETITNGPNKTLSALSGSVYILPSDEPPSPSMNSGRPLVMGYYPDWEGSSLNPEDINFSLYDWIDFAFGVPDASFDVGWDSPDSANLLQRLVNAAHKHGTNAKLSIGGWTGSKFFSSAVISPENQEIFAQNILNLYKKFSLDGIDIDWEYPGHEGAEGNYVNPGDTANFLSLLRRLRTILPPSAKITVAAQTTPFTDASDQPMNDVAEFADVLDWLLIMNYDVWTDSPTPGPNAPLNDECKNSSQPNANAAAAIDAWTKAKFPASKIVLGVPSYGYISNSEASGLRSRSSRLFDLKQHRSFDDGAEEPGTTIKIVGEDGSTTVQFRDLVRQGALVRNTSVAADGPAAYGTAGGFTRHWDTCSNTPWLHSTSVKQIITFDDPGSLYMKAKLAKETGILGVNMFDIHGDTDEWDLIQGVRLGLGITQ